MTPCKNDNFNNLTLNKTSIAYLYSRLEPCYTMNLQTSLGQLRLLALLEGISYLLFGITMPLKYLFAIPEPNFIVGIIHGGLFILYVVSALHNSLTLKWNLKTAFFVLTASVVPFGTFVLDFRILKPIAERKS